MAQIEVAGFGAEHWTVAAEALWHMRRATTAQGPSFGECATYAVAKLTGERLLCLGERFHRERPCLPEMAQQVDRPGGRLQMIGPLPTGGWSRGCADSAG